MTTMKKLLIGVLAFTLLAGPASAWSKITRTADRGIVRSWDDLSWWAQSGATPDPVKDSSRSGYWWWPKEPSSNANDDELWGNRGKIFHVYTPPAPPAPPQPAQPPVAQPPRPTRQIPVFNHVLFDFDRSDLKPEGKAEIDKVIALLKEFPGDTVVIEGHTCNVGAADYNMGLGQRRADAVRKYMLDNGIAANRVTAISKGENEPAVPNDTPANRRLNRRAVFVYSIAN